MKPSIKRISILLNIINPLAKYNFEHTKSVAQTHGIEINHSDAGSGLRFDDTLQEIIDQKPDAAIISTDTLLLTRRSEIVRAMTNAGIPTIYPFREYAEAGGLIVQGADLAILFERAAVYVDKILKGAQPGDLPVQQASAFELILNSKAAKQIGLTFPDDLISRADEFIE